MNGAPADPSRRLLLRGGLALGLAGGAACALPTVAHASAAGGPHDVPDFSLPAVNLRQLVRMQGSLDEEDVPWWFTGMLYAVVGEAQPLPLLRCEGMEIYWFRHVDDGYLLGGNTVTFFRDVESGAYLDEFRNPLTGASVRVRPAVQGGKVGFHYSESGIRPASSRDSVADRRLRLEWHALREHVWLQHQTVYPPGMPPMHGQRQTLSVARGAFDDHGLAALPSAFTATVFMGWLKWLEMGDRPGHLVWHASGVKLRSIDELPESYRARAIREYPERMTANPDAPEPA